MLLSQRDRENYEKGKIEVLVSLVHDELLTIDVAAERLDISTEEFKMLMNKASK